MSQPHRTLVHWPAAGWFALLGPPLGLLAMLTLMVWKDPSELQNASNLADLGLLAVPGLPFAYVLGLIPALIAGLSFGVLLARWPGLLRHAIASALAGALCGLLAALLCLLVVQVKESAWFAGWLGGFSGAGGALFMHARARRASTDVHLRQR